MKIAYIFPGQGSQSVGMGSEFIENFDLAKEYISLANDKLPFKIQDILLDEDKLSQSKFAQPSILFVSSLINAIFKEKINIKPEFALGHSLGEFSANVSANSIDIISAMNLVYNRGEFMQECCDGLDAGMMVVLGLSDEIIEEFIIKKREEKYLMWCANYNLDGQIVLAGKKNDLNNSIEEIKKLGAKRTILLDMSVASHCPLLEPASEKLEVLLNNEIKDSFDYPIIANVNAKQYNNKKDAIVALKEQLIKPVLYKQSISKFDNIDYFIEFGNSKVLSGMNRKITKTKTLTVNSIDSLNKAIDILKG